ncbi:cobalt-precorrin-6A reductase [Magnetovibrio sp.]|uniref:cobalt-precorrin-6A reductase n=1 Tax=Magnetovibrio sp. TaxID=2024836 RepID=UPI002F95D15C
MSASILILGGTMEAAQLAHALAAQRPDLDVTIALAGVTRAPSDMPGHVRIGSFGGAQGLADFIQRRGMKAVIDATHPFAATMTQNAVEACAITSTPRLRLDRPSWTLPQDADIVFVPDADEAARLVARTSERAFVTIGRKQLAAFDQVRDVKLFVRLIDQPDAPLGLDDCTVIVGRPPFDLASEEALMRAHQIDTLVSKASGGDSTRAKIDAAAKVGARIVLIRRPPPPDGDRVSSIEDALGWLYVHV